MASESGSEACIEPKTSFCITGESLRDAVLSLNNGKGATLKDLSKFFLAKGPSWLTPEDVASQLKIALKKGLQGGLLGARHKNKTFIVEPTDDDDDDTEKGSKKRRRIGRSLITDVDNFVRQLKRQRRSKRSKRAGGGKRRRSRKAGKSAAKTHGRRRRRSRGRKRRSGARKGRRVRRMSSKRRGGRKRSRSSRSRR